MNTDMIIPFMPRIVQNKLQPPKLNVKRVKASVKQHEDAPQDRYLNNRLAHHAADTRYHAPDEQQQSESGVYVDDKGQKHVDIEV
ncbi:hypothetical protein DS2_11568 [Catenovulum agarivorans DS-2]|uniref:Uncharacterized protein n=1 Tax=Catenovulum agarivorans DS-2 TaxID=1328313 RepID=W7Q9Y7_9ALTE|nr:hypothetical protein [Catenovulum agarivorans]EWH09604.1 hypothetical protein DS2_11568 [Catenovulum agarivorans DS-2]